MFHIFFAIFQILKYLLFEDILHNKAKDTAIEIYLTVIQ